MNYYGHAVRPAIRTYRREHIEPVAGQVRADSHGWEKNPTNPNPNIKSFNVLSVNEGYNGSTQVWCRNFIDKPFKNAN